MNRFQTSFYGLRASEYHTVHKWMTPCSGKEKWRWVSLFTAQIEF
jgi:hypothetical protein